MTDLGARHPVTRGLEEFAPPAGGWGRWLRLIELEPGETGQVVMQGLDERPLLSLDRVGEGRVALLGRTTPGCGAGDMKAVARSWNCCAAWPIG